MRLDLFVKFKYYTFIFIRQKRQHSMKSENEQQLGLRKKVLIKHYNIIRWY